MRRRTAYGILGLLIAIEGGAFSQFYVREVAASFPRMCDQAAYLGETIDIYQAALEQGAVGALRHSLSGA